MPLENFPQGGQPLGADFELRVQSSSKNICFRGQLDDAGMQLLLSVLPEVDADGSPVEFDVARLLSLVAGSRRNCAPRYRSYRQGCHG